MALRQVPVKAVILQCRTVKADGIDGPSCGTAADVVAGKGFTQPLIQRNAQVEGQDIIAFAVFPPVY
jgi:hypothetical protein